MPELVHGRRARASQPGYTLIELMVVLLIAGVVIAASATGLTKILGRRSVSASRDTYVWLARRGRATAVQMGAKVKVTLVPATGRANMLNNGTLVQTIMIGKEYGVSITSTTPDSVVVCYTPRGIADANCSSSLPTTVTFAAGNQSAVATVQALGQVQAQ